MSIDSNDVGSGDKESSASDSCFNTSYTSTQVKPSQGDPFNVGDDDDDTDEFQAMFMSNRSSSKSRPNYSSTPLVRFEQSKT